MLRGFLHTVRCPQGPPTPWPVAVPRSLLWLDRIPLWGWMSVGMDVCGDGPRFIDL